METAANGLLVKNRPQVRPIPSVVEEFGFDPRCVNPTPIGQGAEHTVYLYAPPSDQKRALKVPRPSALAFKLDLGLDKIDRALMERYLPKYKVPSRVLQNGNKYLIDAEFIAGRPFTLEDVEDYRDQVDDILEGNARMIREAGASVDFFGFDGVKDCLTLAGLRGKPHRLANILVSEDGSLKIIDDSLQHLSMFGTTYDRARGLVLYKSSRLALWATGVVPIFS